METINKMATLEVAQAGELEMGYQGTVVSIPLSSLYYLTISFGGLRKKAFNKRQLKVAK